MKNYKEYIQGTQRETGLMTKLAQNGRAAALLALAGITSGCSLPFVQKMALKVLPESCITTDSPQGRILLDTKSEEALYYQILEGDQMVCTPTMDAVLEKGLAGEASIEPENQAKYTRLKLAVLANYNPNIVSRGTAEAYLDLAAANGITDATSLQNRLAASGITNTTDLADQLGLD